MSTWVGLGKPPRLVVHRPDGVAPVIGRSFANSWEAQRKRWGLSAGNTDYYGTIGKGDRSSYRVLKCSLS
jgi:hypothetical protein